MSDVAEAPARSAKHSLPLVLGITISVFALMYLVFPGVIIGLMIRSGILDYDPKHSDRWEIMRTVFFVPVFLGKHIEPLEDFHHWQMDLVDGVEHQF